MLLGWANPFYWRRFYGRCPRSKCFKKILCVNWAGWSCQIWWGKWQTKWLDPSTGADKEKLSPIIEMPQDDDQKQHPLVNRGGGSELRMHLPGLGSEEGGNTDNHFTHNKTTMPMGWQFLPRLDKFVRSSIFCWLSTFLKHIQGKQLSALQLGESTGAIDPKMLQKYSWPFICAVANLEPPAVSTNYFCFLYLLNWTHLISSRFFSKAGKIVAVWMTALSV